MNEEMKSNNYILGVFNLLNPRKIGVGSRTYEAVGFVLNWSVSYLRIFEKKNQQVVRFALTSFFLPFLPPYYFTMQQHLTLHVLLRTFQQAGNQLRLRPSQFFFL